MPFVQHDHVVQTFPANAADRATTGLATWLALCTSRKSALKVSRAIRLSLKSIAWKNDVIFRSFVPGVRRRNRILDARATSLREGYSLRRSCPQMSLIKWLFVLLRVFE